MNQQQQPRTNPLSLLLAAGLVILLLFLLLSGPKQPAMNYSEVLEAFEEENVHAFTLTADGLLTLYFHEPVEGSDTLSVEIGDTEQFHRDLDETIDRQKQSGVLEYFHYLPADESVELVDVLPFLLLGIAMIAILVLVIRRTGGQNMSGFTKSNARMGHGDSPVTFADVAGADEEKAELQEVVDFMLSPDKFHRLGARIPKGILLEGPPGTGKTLLAKAVAGEAKVQFLSISGSEFLELYVGVGASRVRSLFEQAKRIAPAVVFIDEIDAVGRRRGAGLGGGHDEREQTLNQLLVEMDGFGSNQGVVVLAATNRKDILDPALLRPGRFDRQIHVGRPDRKGRFDILKVHTRKKPLAEDVNLDSLAGATSGFTGADLENLVNEAALMAAKAGQPVISAQNLEDAMLKVIAGPEKRSRVVSDHARRLTAVHEAGHAVAIYHLPTHDPVHQITIVPRGSAGGMTISLPTQEESYTSRTEMLERIVSLMGGRVAEQLFLQDISTGASADIQMATDLARDMVSKYGMSKRLGTVAYGSDEEIFVGRNYERAKSYSEQFAGTMDEEVKALIDEAYARCTQILSDHREKVEAIAAYLLEHETMDRETFEAMMQ